LNDVVPEENCLLNLQWDGEDVNLASVFYNGLVKTPTLAARKLFVEFAMGW
jgi:hypothetical protein